MAEENLKSTAARGGLITMLGQFLKLLLQICSNILLARLLTPDDFGLVAMVTVVATFVVMFKDLGLSQATIQKAEITHEQISNLFWVNVTLGLVLMLFTMLISGYIADFYGRDELQSIAIWLSIGLFIGGASVQHQAILKRRMNYKLLAYIEIGSMATAVGLAIVSALYGLGYWSLIVLQLVQVIFVLIGVWWVVRWVPSLPTKGVGTKSLLGFGGYMTAYGFVNYFARNLDTILIGWRWGAEPVGLYSRSYSLLLLPLGQITAPISSVAVPVLSRLQDENTEFKTYYLRMVKVVAYISMPVVIAMGVLADELILFLLGEKWSAASELFQILAFAAFLQPVISTVGWVYVSLARVKIMLYWGTVSTLLTAVFMLVGLPYGATGVAISYSICTWVLLLPSLYIAYKGTPVSIKSLFQEIKLPIVNALLVLSILLAVKSLLPQGLVHYQVVLLVSVLTILVYSLIFSIPSSLNADVIRTIKSIKANIKGGGR